MNIPSIRILSPSVQFLAEIDTYTSLEYRRSWQGVGTFQAVIPLNAQGVGALAVGNLVMLDNDGRRAGIIRTIRLDTDERGNRLTVTGQALDGFATQRIVVPSNDPYNGGFDNVPALTFVGDSPSPVAAETILKTYADRHMANPSDATRAIPLLTVAPDQGRGALSVWSARYDNLDLVLQQAAEYLDTGWEIALENGGFVFELVPGTDHSATSGAPVIFSLGYETVTSLTRTQGVDGYKNLGYAAGTGDAENRVVLKVTQEQAEPTGIDRQEVFLDCGDLSVVESDTAMSLTDEGLHQLTEYQRENTLTATIPPESSFAYRRDWDLGDLVTIIGGGASYDVRVAEISEQYEPTRYAVNVVFGTPPKHLGRVIQQMILIPR